MRAPTPPAQLRCGCNCPSRFPAGTGRGVCARRSPKILPNPAKTAAVSPASARRSTAGAPLQVPPACVPPAFYRTEKCLRSVPAGTPRGTPAPWTHGSSSGERRHGLRSRPPPPADPTVSGKPAGTDPPRSLFRIPPPCAGIQPDFPAVPRRPASGCMPHSPSRCKHAARYPTRAGRAHRVATPG